MLCCLAVQLQGICIGVTTKNPNSGPVPQKLADINHGDHWFVSIGRSQCTAWHKLQEKTLFWRVDRSAGNTFGCHVSETGELHLYHNGRDVGVAWEGLLTEQLLWGFVHMPGGYKVEANYMIPNGEDVDV